MSNLNCTDEIKVTKMKIAEYANQAKFLSFKNKALHDKLSLYTEFIDNIKNALSLLDHNQSNISNEITNLLKKQNANLKGKKDKVNKEIQIINDKYNRRYEANKEVIESLENVYEKAKEDNFILKNTLKEKEYYIHKFTNELDSIKDTTCQIEETRENFIPYSKKINTQHLTELEKLQSQLAVESKEHNREKVTTERLQTQINTLREAITEHNTIPQTARLSKLRTYFINEDYTQRNDEEEELDSFLLFKDFEEDKDDISKFDENEVGLVEDYHNILTETNERAQNKEEYLTQRVNTVSSFHPTIKAAVPKLNLKQIEFNKIKVYAAFTDRKMNQKQKMHFYDTPEWKKICLTKKVNKEKEKNKKYLEIITKFKNHYLKMKQFIHQLITFLDEESKYPFTERNKK